MDNFLAIDAPYIVRMTFCFFVGGLDMNEAKEDTIHEMRSVISKFSKWPKSGATAILNENSCNDTPSESDFAIRSSRSRCLSIITIVRILSNAIGVIGGPSPRLHLVLCVWTYRRCSDPNQLTRPEKVIGLEGESGEEGKKQRGEVG
jgi:hypothetical protein